MVHSGSLKMNATMMMLLPPWPFSFAQCSLSARRRFRFNDDEDWALPHTQVCQKEREAESVGKYAFSAI